MDTENSNPYIGRPLYLTFAVVGLVLLAGIGLFAFPEALLARWPWRLRPFNARFLGAVYSTELTVVLLTLYVRRWAPMRVTLPMAFSFTTVVTLASVISFNDLYGRRRGIASLWFVIYIVPTLITAFYLWHYRRRRPAVDAPPAPFWRALLRVQGAVLTGYGLGLFLFPSAFNSFWPWRLDTFHSQLYTAIFLTGAVGSFLLARAAAPVEFAALGIAEATFGALAIAGLLIVDRSLNQVDWSNYETWIWVGAFGAMAAVGLILLWQAQRMGALLRKTAAFNAGRPQTPADSD